jgi:hypothetical protein
MIISPDPDRRSLLGLLTTLIFGKGRSNIGTQCIKDYSFIKKDGFVKSRHSGENRSPDRL